jgi:hypothetical protein
VDVLPPLVLSTSVDIFLDIKEGVLETHRLDVSLVEGMVGRCRTPTSEPSSTITCNKLRSQATGGIGGVDCSLEPDPPTYFNYFHLNRFERFSSFFLLRLFP